MKPVWPVVRSLRSMRRPCAVSCSLTEILSPPFIIRSLVGSGVNVVAVALTGFGGACGTPLSVMNAKFTYSSPAVDSHTALFCWPVTGLFESESMFSAAHHCVAEQLMPPGLLNGTQPGG